MSDIFNPIALRKAKIVYNFGLSECNRVKEGIWHNGNMLSHQLGNNYFMICSDENQNLHVVAWDEPMHGGPR